MVAIFLNSLYIQVVELCNKGIALYILTYYNVYIHVFIYKFGLHLLLNFSDIILKIFKATVSSFLRRKILWYEDIFF